jgi:xanthine dehydrogenase accessory factor
MTEEDWSVPETDVLGAIKTILSNDTPAIIATVVGVEGSAYRRPGAKMVVEEDGKGLGHITAGCLEDEVFELASKIIEKGHGRVETYDLMEDDEDVWGLGVGCNGIIDILIEPVDASFEPLVRAFEQNEPVGMVTVVEGDVPLGTKGFYDPATNQIESGSLPEWLETAVRDPARELLANEGADTVEVSTEQGDAIVFIDSITPASQLLVVGSGHDVGPVVELGKKNDYRVTVAGFRGATDLENRFPRADETVTTSPTAITDDVDMTADTYAVVMTHNFIDDRLALEQLVAAEIPYIGLMGPRERFEEMQDEFEAENRVFSDDELATIYTPIGLDLGGGSPYQIATSIVSEVLAVSNERDPKHLKEREGPIHDRATIEVSN